MAKKKIKSEKVEKHVIALCWDNSTSQELFITDAPEKSICAAIDHVQKNIEDYSTDDFFDFMEEDFYIERVDVEEYNF